MRWNRDDWHRLRARSTGTYRALQMPGGGWGVYYRVEVLQSERPRVEEMRLLQACKDREHADRLAAAMQKDANEAAYAGRYAVKCDRCKREMRRTDDMGESAAGGICPDCRCELAAKLA